MSSTHYIKACLEFVHTIDHPDGPAAIAREGGIPVAIRLMKQYKYLKIQSFGCVILQATAADHQDNVREIHENGGVSCLIHAIDKFPDNLVCRQVGLRALRLLVMIDPAIIADNIPVIIKAMDGHVDDIESQAYACGILSFLTWPPDDEQASESSIRSRNCSLLVNNGGIPALVASLENSFELTEAHWQSCEDLMQCSRCKKIFYCDRKCQRKDYKLHKKIGMQMSMKSRANGDIE